MNSKNALIVFAAILSLSGCATSAHRKIASEATASPKDLLANLESRLPVAGFHNGTESGGSACRVDVSLATDKNGPARLSVTLWSSDNRVLRFDLSDSESGAAGSYGSWINSQSITEQSATADVTFHGRDGSFNLPRTTRSRLLATRTSDGGLEIQVTEIGSGLLGLFERSASCRLSTQ